MSISVSSVLVPRSSASAIAGVAQLLRLGQVGLLGSA
jgi:hypothetical protein